jgi:hypothetical protein
MKARGADIGRAPADTDILDYYAAEVAAGGRPLFRSVVELFLTVLRALKAQRGREALFGAASLDTLDPSGEADIALLSDLTGAGQENLLQEIEAIPDLPRMLKNTEKDRLRALVSLEPFTTTLPLTVLRTISFESVQSGILNRIRRGSGGPSPQERAACADAPSYTAVTEGFRDLEAHLATLIRIAFAVRTGPDVDDAGLDHPRAGELLQAGLAALKRLRRTGFDAAPEVLRQPFAATESTLIALHAAVRDHGAAVAALGARVGLLQAFEVDRSFFAAQFARAYAGAPAGVTDELAHT